MPESRDMRLIKRANRRGFCTAASATTFVSESLQQAGSSTEPGPAAVDRLVEAQGAGVPNAPPHRLPPPPQQHCEGHDNDDDVRLEELAWDVSLLVASQTAPASRFEGSSRKSSFGSVDVG